MLRAGLRLARSGEGEKLSALCLRAKAHWGYDADFMEKSRATLRVEPQSIEAGRVVVATDMRDRPLGVYRLDIEGTTIDLGLLFVEPQAIGQGIGRLLFNDAMRRAAGWGFAELTILADPHAAAFYEKMGAQRDSWRASDAIPGRRLPFYRCKLTR